MTKNDLTIAALVRAAGEDETGSGPTQDQYEAIDAAITEALDTINNLRNALEFASKPFFGSRVYGRVQDLRCKLHEAEEIAENVLG